MTSKTLAGDDQEIRIHGPGIVKWSPDEVMDALKLYHYRWPDRITAAAIGFFIAHVMKNYLL